MRASELALALVIAALLLAGLASCVAIAFDPGNPLQNDPLCLTERAPPGCP